MQLTGASSQMLASRWLHELACCDLKKAKEIEKEQGGSAEASKYIDSHWAELFAVGKPRRARYDELRGWRRLPPRFLNLARIDDSQAQRLKIIKTIKENRVEGHNDHDEKKKKDEEDKESSSSSDESEESASEASEPASDGEDKD